MSVLTPLSNSVRVGTGAHSTKSARSRLRPVRLMSGIKSTNLLSQGIEQMPQRVVVEFIHQRQQGTQFPPGETFTRKPAKVMSWQIGNQAAFVLPVRHFTGNQELQVFRIHRRSPPSLLFLGRHVL